jgi:hypothetical protein
VDVKDVDGFEVKAARLSLIPAMLNKDGQWEDRLWIALGTRFLQPSIRLRFDYYVQLVAIKRDWMRVANLKFRSAR